MHSFNETFLVYLFACPVCLWDVIILIAPPLTDMCGCDDDDYMEVALCSFKRHVIYLSC